MTWITSTFLWHNDAKVELTSCYADSVKLPNFVSTNWHCNYMVTFPNENSHIFSWKHNFSSCQQFVHPLRCTIKNPLWEPCFNFLCLSSALTLWVSEFDTSKLNCELCYFITNHSQNIIIRVRNKEGPHFKYPQK